MGNHDERFGLCRHYLVPVCDEGRRKLVIKTHSLTPSEEIEGLGERSRVDAMLGSGRGWKPVAATHDLAIVLEKRRRDEGVAYRLRRWARILSWTSSISKTGAGLSQHSSSQSGSTKTS